MAQTLKFGNGTWATKKGSTLAFNDQDGNYKPLPFTTTRATSATRVNKEGLIEVVEGDRPRIDYTDSAKGALLLEPQRLQKIQYSEAFDNAYWIKPQSSVVSGQASPSGDTNAFKLVEDTSNNLHWLLQPTVLNTSGTFSYSIFAKAGERDYISMGNASGALYSFFDLQNGTVVSSVANAVGSIESFSNGWYRCTVKLTTTGAQAIGVFISTDGSTINYQGNGTSGIYIYGAQLEQGSYPTSYIPTQGATATRLADTAIGSGNSEVFNDSEGVLFADVASFVNDDLNRQISISDGTTSESIKLTFIDEDTLLFERKTSSGNTQDSIDFVSGNFTKIAFQYKSNNYKAFVNGFEISLTQSVNLPTSLNTLNFDNGAGGGDFYGKTKQIQYYSTALTDAELETLTSYSSLSELVTELNLNTL